MTAARAALKWRRAKRARSGPWLRSLGQIRKNHGLIPERSGLEAEGEIIAAGLRKRPCQTDDDRSRLVRTGCQPEHGSGERERAQCGPPKRLRGWARGQG